MTIKAHVILGVTPTTPKKIMLSQKTGSRNIIVLDYNQLGSVKIVDGITYVSADWANFFMPRDPDIVSHFITHRPKKNRKKKMNNK